MYYFNETVAINLISYLVRHSKKEPDKVKAYLNNCITGIGDVKLKDERIKFSLTSSGGLVITKPKSDIKCMRHSMATKNPYGVISAAGNMIKTISGSVVYTEVHVKYNVKKILLIPKMIQDLLANQCSLGKVESIYCELRKLLLLISDLPKSDVIDELVKAANTALGELLIKERSAFLFAWESLRFTPQVNLIDCVSGESETNFRSTIYKLCQYNVINQRLTKLIQLKVNQLNEDAVCIGHSDQKHRLQANDQFTRVLNISLRIIDSNCRKNIAAKKSAVTVDVLVEMMISSIDCLNETVIEANFARTLITLAEKLHRLNAGLEIYADQYKNNVNEELHNHISALKEMVNDSPQHDQSPIIHVDGRLGFMRGLRSFWNKNFSELEPVNSLIDRCIAMLSPLMQQYLADLQGEFDRVYEALINLAKKNVECADLADKLTTDFAPYTSSGERITTIPEIKEKLDCITVIALHMSEAHDRTQAQQLEPQSRCDIEGMALIDREALDRQVITQSTLSIDLTQWQSKPRLLHEQLKRNKQGLIKTINQCNSSSNYSELMTEVEDQIAALAFDPSDPNNQHAMFRARVYQDKVGTLNKRLVNAVQEIIDQHSQQERQSAKARAVLQQAVARNQGEVNSWNETRERLQAELSVTIVEDDGCYLHADDIHFLDVESAKIKCQEQQVLHTNLQARKADLNRLETSRRAVVSKVSALSSSIEVRNQYCESYKLLCRYQGLAEPRIDEIKIPQEISRSRTMTVSELIASTEIYSRTIQQKQERVENKTHLIKQAIVQHAQAILPNTAVVEDADDAVHQVKQSYQEKCKKAQALRTSINEKMSSCKLLAAENKRLTESIDAAGDVVAMPVGSIETIVSQLAFDEKKSVTKTYSKVMSLTESQTVYISFCQIRDTQAKNLTIFNLVEPTQEVAVEQKDDDDNIEVSKPPQAEGSEQYANDQAIVLAETTQRVVTENKSVITTIKSLHKEIATYLDDYIDTTKASSELLDAIQDNRKTCATKRRFLFLKNDPLQTMSKSDLDTIAQSLQDQYTKLKQQPKKQPGLKARFLFFVKNAKYYATFRNELEEDIGVIKRYLPGGLAGESYTFDNNHQSILMSNGELFIPWYASKQNNQSLLQAVKQLREKAENLNKQSVSQSPSPSPKPRDNKQKRRKSAPAFTSVPKDKPQAQAIDAHKSIEPSRKARHFLQPISNRRKVVEERQPPVDSSKPTFKQFLMTRRSALITIEQNIANQLKYYNTRIKVLHGSKMQPGSDVRLSQHVGKSVRLLSQIKKLTRYLMKNDLLSVAKVYGDDEHFSQHFFVLEESQYGTPQPLYYSKFKKTDSTIDDFIDQSKAQFSVLAGLIETKCITEGLSPVPSLQTKTSRTSGHRQAQCVRRVGVFNTPSARDGSSVCRSQNLRGGSFTAYT